MVEWIDYIRNTPLSKVRQEHSAIKDSRELSHAVLAVGVAGHFPPNSCNAMLLLHYKLTLPLTFIIAGHFPPNSCNAMLLLHYKLTLPLTFIILEFSFSCNLRPHQCPHPLTVCHRSILSMVEWIDYIQNTPLSKVR